MISNNDVEKIKLLRPGMNVDVDVHIKIIAQGDDDLVEYGFRRVIITITAVLCALLEIVDTTIALTNMREPWSYIN
jgi:hypothetical protein